MYHHANTNINSLRPSDHDTKSTKSSETRRREIPLAFTNTEWGKEYAANPNWELENSLRDGIRDTKNRSVFNEYGTFSTVDTRSIFPGLLGYGSSELLPSHFSTNHQSHFLHH
ncbi:hypothetical protein KCU71_g15357, partial [Aureobasidium melanogenum]